MKSARREFLPALLLVLLTLTAGFLIQYTLMQRDRHRQEREAEAIADQLLTGIQSIYDAEMAHQAEAAERMRNLPQEKAKRLEELQLDLLTVVSAQSPLPAGFVPQLQTVIGEYQMDARCAGTVLQMIEDCQAAGGMTMICSAYRTQEYQEKLYEDKVQRILVEYDVNRDRAEELAAIEVARPGTSEHQLGLAADIIDESYPYLNELQENTFTQIWLKEHAPEYGFILRYPNGTSDITGIVYEPWHYRYVGEKFAREITKRGLTLEEYVLRRRGR